MLNIAELQVRGVLHILLITLQTSTSILSIRTILLILQSLADSTKSKTTNMSPTDSNSPTNPNNPNGSNVVVPNNDLRCRFCGHNRSKCSICQTPRSHSSAADRPKAKKVPKARRHKPNCCKCKHKNKFVRSFDPKHKERLALIKYTELKIDAAARLRSYIFQALKSEQGRKSPTTCRGFSRMNTGNNHDGPGPSSPSLLVFNCQLPDRSNISTHSLLEHRVLQVENIVLRLILLLSNEDPIDTGILRTVLRTLWNQLATLTRRAFPTLMPSALPNRQAFQNSLRVTSGRVQAVYKKLWAAALQTGVLSRPRGYAASTGRPSELDTFTMERGERSIVSSHDAGIQQLLWKSRTLADGLRFWLALLRAGRSL